MARIVVIGAGVGGLGAALGLADRGHDVLVVERDPPPPTTSGDAAFEEWDRPHVPQFRQAHAFSARSRNLLVRYAPAVLDRLRDDGIEEINFFKLLAPPELHRPEDDEFTGLLSRRPAFELALRLTADGAPTRRDPLPGGRHRPPPLAIDTATGVRIVGVRLGDDVEETADVVIDAGGRRSPTSRLAATTSASWSARTSRTPASPTTPATTARPTRRPCRRSCSSGSARPARRRARAGVHRRPSNIRAHDRRTAPGTRSSGCSGTTGRSTPCSPRSRMPRPGASPTTDARCTTSPRWQAIRTSCRHWMCDGEPVGAGCAPGRRLAVHDEPGLRVGRLDGLDLRVRRCRSHHATAAISAPSPCATTTRWATRRTACTGSRRRWIGRVVIDGAANRCPTTRSPRPSANR